MYYRFTGHIGIHRRFPARSDFVHFRFQHIHVFDAGKHSQRVHRNVRCAAAESAVEIRKRVGKQTEQRDGAKMVPPTGHTP